MRVDNTPQISIPAQLKIPKSDQPEDLIVKEAEKRALAGQDDKSEPEVSKADLEKALDKFSKTAEVFNRHFQFEVHEKTKRIMVKVIDNDTGKVVSEIPSKKILDIVANMQEMVGMLVDQRG